MPFSPNRSDEEVFWQEKVEAVGIEPAFCSHRLPSAISVFRGL
jgi:hypothetical protein